MHQVDPLTKQGVYVFDGVIEGKGALLRRICDKVDLVYLAITVLLLGAVLGALVVRISWEFHELERQVEVKR